MVIHVGPLRRIVRRTVGFCADFKIRIVSFVILVVAEPPATPVTPAMQGGAGSHATDPPPGFVYDHTVPPGAFCQPGVCLKSAP